METDPVSLQDLILTVRWESELSQTEFGVKVADLMGRERPYSRETIGRWESGAETPQLTLPLLYALAVIGRTTIQDLCCKLGYGSMFPRRLPPSDAEETHACR